MLIRYIPPSTSDTNVMRVALNELRLEIDKAFAEYGPVCLLFDLRFCTIGMEQLQFTIRTLLENEQYMFQKLERSVALVPHNTFVKYMCDIFLHFYTPIRPFQIDIIEHEALQFVCQDASQTKMHVIDHLTKI